MEFGLLAAAVVAPPSLRLTPGFQPGGGGRGEAAGVAPHPVEIYAAILLIAACVILIVVRRHPPIGATAALAFTTAAAIRLGTEPMRLTIGGGLTRWYLAGGGF